MHLLIDEAITRAEIEKKLRSVGIESADIHLIGPSLEDVFVALTAKYSNNCSPGGESGLTTMTPPPNMSSRAGEARRGTSQAQ